MGQTIKIPYTIYESDIKYYSQSITITAEQLQKTNALEEIANLYGTDIETLYNLNPEAIKKSGSTYTLENDSILVPKFAKKSEVILEKDKQLKHVELNNNNIDNSAIAVKAIGRLFKENKVLQVFSLKFNSIGKVDIEQYVDDKAFQRIMIDEVNQIFS